MFRCFSRRQRQAKVRITFREDSVLIVIEDASIELALEGDTEALREVESGEVRIWGDNLAFEVNSYSTKPGKYDGKPLF